MGKGSKKMFRHYSCALMVCGLVLCCALLVFVSGHCQTQTTQASSSDTVSNVDEQKKPPTVARERIHYRGGGKKDPFLPLVEEKKEEEEMPLLQVEEATLVGTMVGSNERLALVQDAEKRTYVLREGSRVKNGYLRRIRSDKALFSVAKYGRYRNVELELHSAEREEGFERGVLATAPDRTPKVRPVVLKQQSEPVTVKAPVAAPKNSKFTLQLAAFRREDDAKGLQRWLRERGYETRIEAITIPESGHWYRVRFGMYDQYNAVTGKAEELRNRFNFYCWIVPIDS